MLISPEDGQLLQEDTEAEPAAAPLGVSPTERERSARLMGATAQVLSGEAPRGRGLKPWEPQKLSPTNINIVFDHADGMKTCDIAEKYGMAASRVSVILHHPDAEYLMGEIMGVTADRVADPIERMKSFAHEMINIKLDIVRDPETPRAIKNDIASDFLDRAGYGARHKVEADVKHSISIPAETAASLTEALNESRKVATVDYSRFLAPKLLEGTVQQGSPSAMTGQSQEGSQPTGGHSDTDNGASHDDLPVAPADDALRLALADERESENETRRGRLRRIA